MVLLMRRCLFVLCCFQIVTCDTQYGTPSPPPVNPETIAAFLQMLPDSGISSVQCAALRNASTSEHCNPFVSNPVVLNWCGALGLGTEPSITQSAETPGGQAAKWYQVRAGPCVGADAPQDKELNNMTSAWYGLMRATIEQGIPIGFGAWYPATPDTDNTPSSMFWVDANMTYRLCPLAKSFDCSNPYTNQCIPTYTKAQLKMLVPKDASNNGPCATAMEGSKVAHPILV